MSHNIKTAFRAIRKNKIISLFNFIGLTIGFTVTIFILVWINFEFGFDKHNIKHESIFRLLSVDTVDSEKFSHLTNLVYKPIKDGVPEIEAISRFSSQVDVDFKINDNSFKQNGFAYVDKDFFNIFSIEFIYGNIETALNNPFDIVITEQIANKFFDKNPVGELIEVNNQHTFTVSAVIKDIPKQSHIDITCLSSVDTREKIHTWMNRWFQTSVSIYALLNSDSEISVVEDKVSSILNKTNPDYMEERSFEFEPLKDIHLFSQVNQNVEIDAKRNDFNIIMGLGIFGALILIIGIFNYINLQYASYGNRLKEFNIKKLIGAKKGQLTWQLLLESSIYIFTSLIAALILLGLLPKFINVQFAYFDNINKSILNPKIILQIITLIIFVFLICNIYITKFVFNIKSLVTNRGNNSSDSFSFLPSQNNFLKSAMLSIQFGIAASLIICSIIISKQLNYATNQYLGFDKEQLLIIDNPWENNNNELMKKRYDVIKNELLKRSDVIEVTSGRYAPAEPIRDGYGIRALNSPNDENTYCEYIAVDFDYFKTVRGNIIKGRSFSTDYQTDISNSVVLNESAIKALNLQNPIGEQVILGEENIKIIGVVNDIQFGTIKEETSPTAFCIDPEYSSKNIIVRLNTSNYKKTVQDIKKIWTDIAPNRIFDFEFANERLSNAYLIESKANVVIRIFTIIAIFLSCIGIYGLASLTMQKRTKEIGIRKVNGSTVFEVLMTINQYYIFRIIIAIIIAFPLSWYVMHSWLQNYAYMIQISWWVFAVAGLSTLVIGILTIIWHSWKVAIKNPVDALRYE